MGRTVGPAPWGLGKEGIGADVAAALFPAHSRHVIAEGDLD